MQRALTTILILGGLVATTPASAQRKASILVLKLEAEGLPQELATVLDEAVRDGVRRSKRWKLLPTPALDFPGMQMAAGCLDDGPDCLASMGRPLSANRVMRVHMSGTQKSATFTFTMVAVGQRRARPQTYEAKLEDLSAESAEELTWHTMTMLGAKPPPLGGSIQLVMASNIGTLDGAEYFLDDKKVPKSALETVPPGRHRLEVHQRGFETFIWMGEVKRGRTETVRVELKPKGALAYDPPPPSTDETPPVETPPVTAEVAPPPPAIDPPPPPPPIGVTTTPGASGPKYIYTWVLGGAAVAAAAVGTVFLLQGYGARNSLKKLTGAANYQGCTGAKDKDGNPPTETFELDDPRCEPFRKDVETLDRSTIGNFAGYITAGLLAAGAVGVFFWERSAADDVATDVAFGVAPLPDGGAVSMTFDF